MAHSDFNSAYASSPGLRHLQSTSLHMPQARAIGTLILNTCLKPELCICLKPGLEALSILKSVHASSPGNWHIQTSTLHIPQARAIGTFILDTCLKPKLCKCLKPGQLAHSDINSAYASSPGLRHLQSTCLHMPQARAIGTFILNTYLKPELCK